MKRIPKSNNGSGWIVDPCLLDIMSNSKIDKDVVESLVIGLVERDYCELETDTPLSPQPDWDYVSRLEQKIAEQERTLELASETHNKQRTTIADLEQKIHPGVKELKALKETCTVYERELTRYKEDEEGYLETQDELNAEIKGLLDRMKKHEIAAHKARGEVLAYRDIIEIILKSPAGKGV